MPSTTASTRMWHCISNTRPPKACPHECTADRRQGIRRPPLRSRIAVATAALKTHHQFTPGLAVILVGDDPASAVYVRNKRRACDETGITSFETLLPATVTQADLLKEIDRLNRDDAVHGILVQLPLPDHIDAQCTYRSREGCRWFPCHQCRASGRSGQEAQCPARHQRRLPAAA